MAGKFVPRRFFIHHTDQELQKSALSCYICSLLLDRLEQPSLEDDSAGNAIVSYISIEQSTLTMRCDYFRRATAGPHSRVASSWIQRQPFSGKNLNYRAIFPGFAG